MKKTLHCIHHTHWDLIWYFTAQDAMVQFNYNIKEMIKHYKENRITTFLLDGQVQPIEEYLDNHPEDRAYIKTLAESGRLEIGPFHSQLDCFISSGESVINNLRLGIRSANKIGKTSRIAYLPDSFGHSYDFPKLFNQFKIDKFVITRGVGDEYNVGSEFYLESNDGSKVLTAVMIAGYGYGTYAFKNGSLLEGNAVDYNKIDVQTLFDRLLAYSTLENEFVFPLGFDQNPAIPDIQKQIDAYNQKYPEYHFVQTTWKEYLEHVERQGKNIKTHRGELFSTQYHRVHRSIFSGRSDIKAIQDHAERVLTYELQPLMVLMDDLGVEYDHGLLDRAWQTLITTQTHSSANLTDATNQYIEVNSKNALAQAVAMKTYLMKLASVSLNQTGSNEYPLLVFNTSVSRSKNLVEATILTKTSEFSLWNEKQEVDYVLILSEQKNHGVLRTNPLLDDQSTYYYEHKVLFELTNLEGLSYRTLIVKDEVNHPAHMLKKASRAIENDYYRIFINEHGIAIQDKRRNVLIERALYLEDMGDQGDSFDYSYPNEDMRIVDLFEDARVSYQQSNLMATMEIKGCMPIPTDLLARKKKQCDGKLTYTIELTLKQDCQLIEVQASLMNQAKEHRVRLVVNSGFTNDYSYAGTQFSYIQRDCNPTSLKTWRNEQWFEEPSTTFPLLNFVSGVHECGVATVLTKGPKEYQFIEEHNHDIAVTAFRSYGALGKPDLNRRPGRPSGLDYRVFETESTYMMGLNTCEFAFYYESSFNTNKIHQSYIDYASPVLTYQKQPFDKSLELISYFPTNPLPNTLPNHHQLLFVEACQGAVSTLVKMDTCDAYMMRLFNSEEHQVSVGKIMGKQVRDLGEVNLNEDEMTHYAAEIPDLKIGEYRNILIKKGK